MKTTTNKLYIWLESIFKLHKFNQVSLKLKVQSCKLYINKYMIASPQIKSTEIFAFIAAIEPKSFVYKHKIEKRQ